MLWNERTPDGCELLLLSGNYISTWLDEYYGRELAAFEAYEDYLGFKLPEILTMLVLVLALDLDISTSFFKIASLVFF